MNQIKVSDMWRPPTEAYVDNVHKVISHSPIYQGNTRGKLLALTDSVRSKTANPYALPNALFTASLQEFTRRLQNAGAKAKIKTMPLEDWDSDMDRLAKSLNSPQYRPDPTWNRIASRAYCFPFLRMNKVAINDTGIPHTFTRLIFEEPESLRHNRPFLVQESGHFTEYDLRDFKSAAHFGGVTVINIPSPILSIQLLLAEFGDFGITLHPTVGLDHDYDRIVNWLKCKVNVATLDDVEEYKLIDRFQVDIDSDASLMIHDLGHIARVHRFKYFETNPPDQREKLLQEWQNFLNYLDDHPQEKEKLEADKSYKKSMGFVAETGNIPVIIEAIKEYHSTNIFPNLEARAIFEEE